LDQSASFAVGAAPRRSTSSLGTELVVSTKLTNAVKQQVKRFFLKSQVDAVTAELKGVRLPLISDNGERVHLAVLLMSRGDIETFRRLLKEATIDWRDTLVSAGLADEDWPEVLRHAGVHGFREARGE
jgi:hypothetical protein